MNFCSSTYNEKSGIFGLVKNYVAIHWFPCKSKSMHFSHQYDVGRMGKYTRNILQWNKNDIKAQE